MEFGALADVLRLGKCRLAVRRKKLDAAGRSKPPFVWDAILGRPFRDMIRNLLL